MSLFFEVQFLAAIDERPIPRKILNSARRLLRFAA
jgi:hypothetical protein